MQNLQILITNLKIPIDNINFKEEVVELVLKNSIIGIIPYLKKDESIIFDYSETVLKSIRWELIAKLELESIKKIVAEKIGLQNQKLLLEEFPLIQLSNNGNISFAGECVYIDSKWVLYSDINFELKKRDNAIKTLESQLNQINQNVQQNNYLDYQGKMFTNVMNTGGDLFKIWLDAQSKSEKQEIELINEFEKQELDVVNELDKRDKLYKGGLLICCLILMGVLAFLDKASTVLPIIGVVIGLVLQSDSVSKYFSGSTKKRNSKYNDED